MQHPDPGLVGPDMWEVGAQDIIMALPLVKDEPWLPGRESEGEQEAPASLGSRGHVAHHTGPTE